MSEPNKIPRAEPPAWPVSVEGRVHWVAMGPFGLLKKAYGSSSEARAAAIAELHNLWRIQALRDIQQIYELRPEITAEDVNAPYVDPEKIAVEISIDNDEKIFVVVNKDINAVDETGFESYQNLVNEMQQNF